MGAADLPIIELGSESNPKPILKSTHSTIDILHLHCFGQRLVEDVHPKQCKCRMSNVHPCLYLSVGARINNLEFLVLSTKHGAECDECEVYGFSVDVDAAQHALSRSVQCVVEI